MSDTTFDPFDAYNRGLVGARHDPRAEERLIDAIMRGGGDADGGRVAYEWGLANAGKGKLSMIYPYVEQFYQGTWPGPTQLTGDCVAKAAANVILGTLCVEAAMGKPDEVTGFVEEVPQVSPAAAANIPIASESLWMWRGYDQDGWNCHEAARVAVEIGFLARGKYPFADFTQYTKQSIRFGGSRRPSDEVKAECAKRRVRTATILTDWEQARDYIACGFAVLTCSNLGFGNKRDENGVVLPNGKSDRSWAHAQGIFAVDDRPEIVKKYGETLSLWLNQWAVWNSGPRGIYGTNLVIPEGSYWVKASELRRTKMIAFSSIHGWPRAKMTDFGATGNI